MYNIRLLTTEQIHQIQEDWNLGNNWSATLFEYLWQEHPIHLEKIKLNNSAAKAYLLEHYYIPQSTIAQEQHSADGTIKCAIRLHDGQTVEAVLIPAKNRMTACISCQVGCSLNCNFCATGTMGRIRNLDYDEIADQAYLINALAQKYFNKDLSNIVFMGMGEPLLNYKAVQQAIQILCYQKGLNIAAKRITLSTAGIAKQIVMLAEAPIKVNLALSLHAPTDLQRNQIMAINERNNLQSLAEALKRYYQLCRKKISIEYLLLEGFNDRIEDAQALIEIYHNWPVRVINLIEYNNGPNSSIYRKPQQDKIDQFVNYLHQYQVNAYLRHSRGKDIDAACGQLALQTQQHHSIN